MAGCETLGRIRRIHFALRGRGFPEIRYVDEDNGDSEDPEETSSISSDNGSEIRI